MRWVFEEFEIRAEEIDKYFDFVTTIENNNSVIANDNGGSLSLIYKFDPDLTRILKANSFLLLYNLVESTIINGIFEIFNSIKIEKVTYKQISLDLKRVWLNTRLNHDKNIAKETIVNQMLTMVDDILNSAMIEIEKSQIKFQGNLDADNIYILSKTYGISNHPAFRKDTVGEAFKEIKEKRNLLAHGELTFKECGKDFTIQQISEYKSHIVAYLKLILENIQGYIDKKEFLCA